MTRRATRGAIRFRGVGGSGGLPANGYLTQWATALGDRATAPAVWLGIGESLQEGQGASTVDQRWFDKALATLRSTYPTSGVTGGFGYIPARRRVYGPDSSAFIDGASSYTGTLSTVWEGFGNYGHKLVSMSSGATVTFTVSGTAVDIDWVRGPGGGTFTWRVDGGSTTSVSTNGAYQASVLTRITFGSRGSHTVTIACSATPVYLGGVFVYDQDESAGIRGVDGGWTSATIAVPFLEDTSSSGWPTTLATIVPDLVTIELNGNDIINGTSMTTFEANARSLIGILKALSPVPSIVWLTSYQVASGVTSNSAGPYDAKIKALATELSFGVLSWYDTVDQVGTGTSVGLFRSDGIHPNNDGHTMLANSVVGYLTT